MPGRLLLGALRGLFSLARVVARVDAVLLRVPAGAFAAVGRALAAVAARAHQGTAQDMVLLYLAGLGLLLVARLFGS